MTKELLLVSYPPLETVLEQLSLPDGLENRYGEYTGQRKGMAIDEKTRNVDEVFETFYIAPQVLERIPSNLGRITILGVTKEGEKVKVDIDPFSDLDTLGTISLGDEAVNEQKIA